MCVIITVIMLGFAIQNLMVENWVVGGTQLLIALGFVLLLINNICRTRAERAGECYTGCSITNWISNLVKKKESK